MPKAKKPSAFMFFVKERYPNLPVNDAVNKAGKEWEAMPKDSKDKYAEKCKNGSFEAKPREKYTSQGIPISYVEKEKQDLEKKERSIKAEIQDIVNFGRNTGDLINVTFNFVSVNYFSKTSDGSLYTPAEIAFSAYSLKDGIKNRYHSLVNPMTVPYGHAFETKQHSEDTHQLGVPPDVEGERDLEKLYLNCLEFIRENNQSDSEYPPLFTYQDIPMVESVLQILRSSCLSDEPTLRIYPLHELFYTLKKTTSEMGETKPPESKHITNAYLAKDIYEYQTDIACGFHEKKDRAKYCALSCVTRWGYTFSDHLCQDLALNMEPGHHVPKNADLIISDTFSESNFNSSIMTQPKVEREHLELTYSTAIDSIENFPSLNDTKKKKIKKNDIATDTMTTNSFDNVEANHESVSNPWSRNSRTKTCRRPTEESFSFDLSGYDEFFKKPKASGRGLLFDKSTEKPKLSKGRGLAFGD